MKLLSVSRNHVVLFPEAVQDYITEDNPVRFIDAFVEPPPRVLSGSV